MKKSKINIQSWLTALGLLLIIFILFQAPRVLGATSQSGSTGIQGEVPGPPPSRGATIDIPSNGQTFSNLPITVSGLCPPNVLVEIYKNNVFAGSAECTNGSYSLQIDLFDGRNDLVAKVFDNLNQAGPNSNTVTVTYQSAIPVGGQQIALTTQFSKRGANPGEILSWPITLTGGVGPYAISVDWGDKSNPDLISEAVPGNFNIQHTYAQAGVYKVTVKATDSKGDSAFLQLVAIANGPINQSGTNAANSNTIIEIKVLIWPVIVLFILMLVAFYVGRRHQLEAIKNKLRKGEPPL
jgi:hypothetical protein